MAGIISVRTSMPCHTENVPIKPKTKQDSMPSCFLIVSRAGANNAGSKSFVLTPFGLTKILCSGTLRLMSSSLSAFETTTIVSANRRFIRSIIRIRNLKLISCFFVQYLSTHTSEPLYSTSNFNLLILLTSTPVQFNTEYRW